MRLFNFNRKQKEPLTQFWNVKVTQWIVIPVSAPEWATEKDAIAFAKGLIEWKQRGTQSGSDQWKRKFEITDEPSTLKGGDNRWKDE